MNDPVLSVRIKNDKEGPQTGDVVLNGSAINEWASGNTYDIGDVVVYEGQLYQSLEEQVAGTSFDYDKWEQIGIPDIIVPDFQTNTHYFQNQVVYYDGSLYKAKQDFTSSTRFYEDDWDSVSGETYSFTSEDRTVTITINDNTVDFSVDSYVKETKQNLENLIDTKVDKVEGKGLSTQDYTTLEKTKLQNLASIFSIGDNLVLTPEGKLNAGFSVDFDASLDKTSTNGIQNKPVAEAVEALNQKDDLQDTQIQANRTNIATNATNIGQNTADITEIKSELAADEGLLNNKVDKVDGKELSSNDYTDEDQTKLNGLAKIYRIGARLTLDAETNTLSANDQSIELLQETGQSTTKGMSQKGITDAIADAISGGIGVLAPVATSGSYDDLIDTPTIDTTLSSSSENAVQNKVIKNALDEKANTDDLSQVAFSGNYSDLNGTPIVDAVLSDSSENAVQNKVIKEELDNKANSSDLAPVATSGSYDDLIDTPSGAIRIFKDDDLTLVGSFNLNQKTSSRIDLPLTNIRTYTEGKAYAIDDIVVLDGSIYRANKAIASAPATMNDSDWEQIGGSDAIIINVNSSVTPATWTSNASFNDIRDAVGKKLIFFTENSGTNYYVAERAANNTGTSSTIDFYIETRDYNGSQYFSRTISIALKSDGTTGFVPYYDATGDSTGKAKQTVGTLTVKDAEGTSLGTFNGSANTTITLPESFEVLTTTEIDNIWENA